MKRPPLNILSLFDGISCGQLALLAAGILYDKYYASEIDPVAISITQHHFPDTIQVGDVKSLTAEKLGTIGLILAGFPCQSFSLCGRRKGFSIDEKVKVTTLEHYLKLKAQGFEFEGTAHLFWEAIRIVKMFPKALFFFENTKMTPEWERVISRELGVKPIKVNSSLVSVQNRERYYWTNIPYTPIQDKGLKLSDIIPGAVAAGIHGRKVKGAKVVSKRGYSYPETRNSYDKAYCVTTKYNSYYYIDEIKHQYTAEHAEIFQTLPVGYTNVNGLCKTKRIKPIGNGWTIDVVSQFFKNIPQ
jgi:site-specific DNA-cytosine methylase